MRLEKRDARRATYPRMPWNLVSVWQGTRWSSATLGTGVSPSTRRSKKKNNWEEVAGAYDVDKPPPAHRENKNENYDCRLLNQFIALAAWDVSASKSPRGPNEPPPARPKRASARAPGSTNANYETCAAHIPFM